MWDGRSTPRTRPGNHGSWIMGTGVGEGREGAKRITRCRRIPHRDESGPPTIAISLPCLRVRHVTLLAGPSLSPPLPPPPSPPDDTRALTVHAAGTRARAPLPPVTLSLSSWPFRCSPPPAACLSRRSRQGVIGGPAPHFRSRRGGRLGGTGSWVILAVVDGDSYVGEYEHTRIVI